MRRRPGFVSLDRALSKLGLASRAEARALISAGRVTIDGRRVTDPATPVVPERVTVNIDGELRTGHDKHRTIIALHKPRGVVTTRRDPEGRQTVFDVLGDAGRGLVAIGRLDLASTGLLLFTNDTQLAESLTNPSSRILRRYVVTVRGRVSEGTARDLERGIETTSSRGSERVAARAVVVRKASARETHLLVDLVEGKNREIRRLFESAGHEVTRVHRVAFGPFELGDLQPGQYREVDYRSSVPKARSHRSPSRQSGQTAATSRQKRRE